jgi:hypothetical protein
LLTLSGLDHFAKRELKVPHYQRYMDDMTFFADSRMDLDRAREAIAMWLERERRLELKRPEERVASTRSQFLYLGYEVCREGFRPGPRAHGRFLERCGELALRGDRQEADRTASSYRGLLFPGISGVAYS